MVLFPIYMVTAVAGERPWVDDVVRTISVALFGLMTALFAAHSSITFA